MPIPALQLLPQDYDADLSNIPAWLFVMGSIPPMVEYELYVTSQLYRAYRYYKKDKSCVITADHPPAGTWEHEIGNKYQSQERDEPQAFWFCRAYVKNLKRSVVWVIDKATIMKVIKKAFSENPNIFLDDNSVLNAVAHLTYDKTQSAQLMYGLRFSLKPCEAPPVIASAKEPWYPQNYSNGGNNPFEPPKTAPTQVGVPATGNGTAAPAATDDSW